MLIKTSFRTPLGWLEIEFDEQFIYHSYFINTNTPTVSQIDTALSQLIREELNQYFADYQHFFNLPLKPIGTTYQQQVWQALLTIPAGQTKTYGELAHLLQTSPRAIGQACKTNPLALFIPCHRIVAKNSLGGYMGNNLATLDYKINSLRHENFIA